MPNTENTTAIPGSRSDYLNASGNISQYVVEKVLGEGAYGLVVKARCTTSPANDPEYVPTPWRPTS